MTIFKLEGGKVKPVAIVKGGVSTPFTGAAPAAAAPAAAPAPAAPAKDAKKEEPKKDEKKK
jgi:ribosomal protein L12E/L44/L45/RPP1/RPP2